MRPYVQRFHWLLVFLGILLTIVPRGHAAPAPKTGQDTLALSILGRRIVGSDHVTVSNLGEFENGTVEGQMFYVPMTGAAGNHPLYRVYNPTIPDYMDSLTTAENGYGSPATLGSPFNSQLPGTRAIQRWRNMSTKDVLTAFYGETPAGATQDPGVLGYGFPRYGTMGTSPLPIQGSQVTLLANKVAGGAVSELWWNGKEFINDYDYGRQIQAAMNLTDNTEEVNPTEAGDHWGWPPTSADWAHGSPLLSASASGTRLITSCHPLEWNPETFVGGGLQGLLHPVMWQGTITRQADLDFGGSPNVIRWITTIDFPSNLKFLRLEVVTAYLNSEFTRFYAFDAQANTIDDMTALVPNGGCLDPAFDPRLQTRAGGVVIATADGAYALGIYRKDAHNLFGLCDFPGSGSGQYGYATSKWNFLYRQPQGVKAGRYSWTSYLLVGTLNQVRSEARRLYTSGY